MHKRGRDMMNLNTTKKMQNNDLQHPKNMTITLVLGQELRFGRKKAAPRRSGFF